MSIVLTWPGKAKALAFGEAVRKKPTPLIPIVTGEGCDMLIQGDNLSAAAALLSTHRERFDLIAIDPPFAAGMDFRAKVKTAFGRHQVKAYADKWKDGTEGYLDMIVPRLAVFVDLLKPNGSLVVHCDWRVSHCIRSLLDELMPNGFRNQIAWIYSNTGRGAKAHAGQFPRNHDQLIWAAKGKKPQFHGDTFLRHFTAKEARRRGFRQDENGRWYKTAPRGDYTDKSIEKLRQEGRIHTTSSGKIRIKYFLTTKGRDIVEELPVGDAWLDIPDAMHLSKNEQTGYATQKPLKLQQRLIKALTSPGDLIGDFFCGSGSTLVAAAQLNRRFIGCDKGDLAIHTTYKRLFQYRPSLHSVLEPKWLEVDVFLKKTPQGLALVPPVSWPSHAELKLSPPDWVDLWAIGVMGEDGFSVLWHSKRQNGCLEWECRDNIDHATHVLVWDVLGRKTCLPIMIRH